MTKTVEIPGYKVKKVLGIGGMAKVFLAQDAELDRKVAIKVLNPELTQNPRITRRFVREAKTAASLHHSNIISIYKVGKHKGIHYITMEYLEESLDDRLNKGPVIKPRKALAIVKEVAKALKYAHKLGVVHRDIKPENIMFRKDGAVVLVDFGIAKVISEKEKTRLTRTGMSIGTPHYMSPEQLKARKLDGRTDIYSLGIVLFQVITGKLPFDSDDVVTLALKHTGDPVPTLGKRLKEFQPLIDKMLAKRPSERVRNAEGLIRLIDALEFKLKESTVNIKRPVQIREKKSRRVLPAIALIVVVTLLAASFYLIRESKRRDESSAWEQARSTHTSAAYNDYLENYPEGKHHQDAQRAIAGLKTGSRFQRLLREADEFYNQGLYQNALKKIKEAKRIKVTRQLNILEKQINDAIAKNRE